MSNPLPLTRLTFIRKKVRNQLRRRGLVTTSDLLRCATLALRESLGKSTTIADVGSWQAVCSVLEIEGMSLPWAWALSQRGIVAARDFGQRALSHASAVFAEAKRRGDIAPVPTADALVAMMLDSARIRLGGLLNATVEGPGHKTLAGARVVCAAVEGITDSHGRVRLLRLPLGQRVDVRIGKSGYAGLTSTLAGLHGVQVIEGHHFSLKRSRSRKRHIARALSEFQGDVLPNLTGARIHPIEVRNQPLRVGDVVRFFEQLQRGDAKLVSVFKAVEAESSLRCGASQPTLCPPTHRSVTRLK